MSKPPLREVPSPLLPMEEVNEALVRGVSNVGRAFSLPGTGGAAASGAAFTTKRLKTYGEQATFSLPRTEMAVAAIRQRTLQPQVLEQFAPLPGAPEPALQLIGMMQRSASGLNACLMQLVWFEHQLHATTHAKEGLIKQRTAWKAMNALAGLVQELHGQRR